MPALIFIKTTAHWTVRFLHLRSEINTPCYVCVLNGVGDGHLNRKGRDVHPQAGLKCRMQIYLSVSLSFFQSLSSFLSGMRTKIILKNPPLDQPDNYQAISSRVQDLLRNEILSISVHLFSSPGANLLLLQLHINVYVAMQRRFSLSGCQAPYFTLIRRTWHVALSSCAISLS